MTMPDRCAVPKHWWVLMFVSLAPLLSVGCATVPEPRPETSSLRQQQETVLRELGFDEFDDGWLMSIAEPISFDFDESDLRDPLRQKLLSTARGLLDVQIAQVRTEGHTDNQGSSDYNLALSHSRSEAVAGVFVEAGFESASVTAVGRGSEFPIASNLTREGRAENRRVHVIIPAQALSAD